MRKDNDVFRAQIKSERTSWFTGAKKNSTGTCLVNNNDLEERRAGVDIYLLQKKETVHMTRKIEG